MISALDSGWNAPGWGHCVVHQAARSIATAPGWDAIMEAMFAQYQMLTHTVCISTKININQY